MALRLEDLKRHVMNAAGDAESLSSGLDPQQIVNEAGRYLCSSHPWQFLLGAEAFLDYAAPVTANSGTWVESTLSYTSTGSFSSYTYTQGDVLTLTAGTNVTNGEYPIASKTDSDAIVLEQTITDTAGNLTTGDITASIQFPYVSLPSDLVSIDSITPSNGLQNSFQLLTVAELQVARQAGWAYSPTTRIGAVSYPQQTAVGSAMGAARLEIFPTPTAAEQGALILRYKRDWTELSDADSVANIPTWLETSLLAFVRAFADGYESKGNKLSESVQEIENSILYNNMKERDGLVQSTLGPTINGHLSPRRLRGGVLFGPIGGPV